MNIFHEYLKAKSLHRLRHTRKCIILFFNKLQEYEYFGNLNFKRFVEGDIEIINDVFDCQINQEYFESFLNDELPFSQYDKNVFLSRLKAYEERWLIVMNHYQFKTNPFFKIIVWVKEEFRIQGYY